MEKIGITKEIDDLGRLQIPKDIQERLGLKKNVQLIITKEGLLIKKEGYRLVKLADDSLPNQARKKSTHRECSFYL